MVKSCLLLVLFLLSLPALHAQSADETTLIVGQDTLVSSAWEITPDLFERLQVFQGPRTDPFRIHLSLARGKEMIKMVQYESAEDMQKGKAAASFRGISMPGDRLVVKMQRMTDHKVFFYNLRIVE